MTHLGSWLSALADGQLPPDETERALVHVVGCPRCTAELATARATRRVLSNTAAEPLEPASGLTARLLSLAPEGLPGRWSRPDPFAAAASLPGRSAGMSGQLPQPGHGRWRAFRPARRRLRRWAGGLAWPLARRSGADEERKSHGR